MQLLKLLTLSSVIFYQCVSHAEEGSVNREPARFDSAAAVKEIEAPKETGAAQSNEKLQADSLQIRGSIDFYYLYNFNSPSTVTAPAVGALPNSQNTYRAFDVSHDSLQLALARLTVQKQVGRLGLLLDLGFGPSMMLLSGTAVDSTQFGLKQAILSYKSESGILWEAGRFATHVGYEYADSSDNWNYSRSLMYGFLQPYWHQGVRASYGMGNLTVMGSVVDGWNSGYESNNDKGYGLQLAWNPNERASLVANVLTGREPTAANLDESARKAIYDLLGSLKVSESLAFAFNADFYSVKPAQGAHHNEAYAVAGYAKYSFLPEWSLAPRVEYFSDPNNAALGGTFDNGQNLMSYTLTLEDRIAPNLTTKLEGRVDASSENAFQKNDIAHKTQTTMTFAILAGF